MLHQTFCHDCDWPIEIPALSAGQKAFCPRCSAVVAEHKHDPLLRALGFSLAGLLFYLPANTLAVLTFEVMSQDSTNTMLGGVLALFSAGFWWMALLVLLCSVVAPLVNLLLLFICSVFLSLSRPPSITRFLLLAQWHLKEWSMLEVYMLSILVAYIKMSSMGHLLVGVGLYCFVGMLLSAVLAQHSFDTQYAFEQLESKLR